MKKDEEILKEIELLKITIQLLEIQIELLKFNQPIQYIPIYYPIYPHEPHKITYDDLYHKDWNYNITKT